MALSHFSNVKLSGISCIVPENFIDIDDEISFYENKKILERNKKILGLGKRHIVQEGISTNDLAQKACEILIENMSIDISEIDTLLFASINHDYLGNCNACILQNDLGLSEETACIDTSGLGCTDVVYGLWLAHSLIQSGASKKCLFVEGSLSSRITDKENRNSNMLFGDGATAILLEYSDLEKKNYFHLMSRGKDWKKITMPAGGCKLPIRQDITNISVKDPIGNPIMLWDSVMNGNEVFRFATEIAPYSLEKIINYSGKKKDDIDFFALHQANAQIVRTVINHAGIPKNKASSETFTTYGNCGGTSVMMNYCHKMAHHNAGDVCFLSFGVGLSAASCILNLEDTKNLGVSFYPNKANVQSRENLIQEWVNFIETGENDHEQY